MALEIHIEMIIDSGSVMSGNIKLNALDWVLHSLLKAIRDLH